MYKKKLLYNKCTMYNDGKDVRSFTYVLCTFTHLL